MDVVEEDHARDGWGRRGSRRNGLIMSRWMRQIARSLTATLEDAARRRQSRRYGDGGGDVNALGPWSFSRLRDLVLALGLALSVAVPPAAAAAPRILALGDSLTAGYGLAPEEAFPIRLRDKLASVGTKVEMINGGVSGDTTAGGLARLDWALADKPDYVLVELGANDALRGIDPKVTRANLDKILARIATSGAKTLLIGFKAPRNWGADYEAEFDAIYPELAAKYQVPLYPFFLDGVVLDAALNQPDGLHPNQRGVQIIVDRIAPYVERLISGAAAKSPGTQG
jgi:acyl-CoA thioesterase-1